MFNQDSWNFLHVLLNFILRFMFVVEVQEIK